MSDQGSRLAEESKIEQEEDKKRAAFIAQQALVLEKRISVAERVMCTLLSAFRSHSYQRLEAARLASQGISLPSVLTSEFGFSPSEKESTEAWLTRVTADSAEFQGNVSTVMVANLYF